MDFNEYVAASAHANTLDSIVDHSHNSSESRPNRSSAPRSSRKQNPRNRAKGNTYAEGNEDFGSSSTPRQSRHQEQTFTKTPSKKRPMYSEYISHEEAMDGIANKKMYSGEIRINKRDRFDSYVTVDGLEKDIRIYGLKSRNRALEGDHVVIEILSGSELEKLIEFHTKVRTEKDQKSEDRQKKCDIEDPLLNELLSEDENDGFEQEEKEDFEYSYGKVVYILETRKNRLISGMMMVDLNTKEETPQPVSSDQKVVWFRPNDNRFPYVCIPTDLAPSEYLKNPAQYSNTLFSATIKKWPVTANYPFGAVLGPLGQLGELLVETEALLNDHGIDWNEFPEDVEQCLPKLPWKIPESEFKKRIDLRDLRIFSIDPQTARDLDDALSVKKIGDDLYEVGVHIADVSYFVKSNSALDLEAAYRSTTVYLVQKAIPMLPRILCEELCSLNPDVERLAFSVFFKMNSNGQVLEEPVFGRSVIKSCGKLSYEHAQALIEGLDLDKCDLPPLQISKNVSIQDIRSDIMILYKMSLQMRKERFENGALTMQNLKLWFSLDESFNPTSCGVYELRDSNRLIEEFMLLANMAVAKKIGVSYPEVALLRKHGEPGEKPMSEFLEIASKLGYNIDASSSFKLQQSFDAIKDEEAKIALRLLCIKPMKRAKYFCSGVDDISTFHHYALSCPLYTHFTSPIRRYCDLIVHRLLDASIRGIEENALADDLELDTPKVGNIAKQCNLRKECSKNAQDASQKAYLCAYLNNLSMKGDLIEEALVYKISSRSFDVLVFKYGIEKRVYVEDLIDLSLVKGCKYDSNSGSLRIIWNSDSPQNVTEAMAGLDLNSKDLSVQKIKVFDKIMVKIEILKKRSPWDIKVYAIHPNRKLENKNNAATKSTDSVCLGILDVAD